MLNIRLDRTCVCVCSCGRAHAPILQEDGMVVVSLNSDDKVEMSKYRKRWVDVTQHYASYVLG